MSDLTKFAADVEKACPCEECKITDRIALQIENDFEDGILEESK